MSLMQIQTGLEELLVQQDYLPIASKLLALTAKAHDKALWDGIFIFLQRIPAEPRVQIFLVASVYAKALMYTDQHEALLLFCQQATQYHGLKIAAPVLLECARSHLGLQEYQQAYTVLNTAIEHLTGEQLGIALGKLGLAQFYLKMPWQETFEAGLPYLTKLDLGYTLLNFGAMLDKSGQRTQAQAIWTQALPHLKSDGQMLALTRYNLGISMLQTLEPESERHFLEARRLTKRATTVQGHILNGLAITHRMLGEWNRAETSYRYVLHASSNANELENAYFGLAQTLILSGRAPEALEILMEALPHNDMYQIARATAYLTLRQPALALAALAKVTVLHNVTYQWLEKINQAEIARLASDVQQAKQLLADLPTQTLHAREAAYMFGDLMRLLESAGQPFAVPLSYAQTTVVEVTALGLLRVCVNKRPVPLAPTSRAGQLLVYLLEQDGSASIDTIADTFGAIDRRKARGLIWKWVKQLRLAFGWESSVVALRGAYQLDPKAIWHYDVQQARASRNFNGKFMTGVYSDWALEVGRSLEQYSYPS